MRTFITTAIPYVNSKPHLGFAMELVETDVMARHRRHRGNEVRFLSGTDDNSLKNVQAAEAEGVSTQELVDRNAQAFHDLRGPLQISFDDFIRTSSDPRHRPGVARLWRAANASGDLYHQHYEGLYCVGCEQFYAEAELVEGNCPEHLKPPQLVGEENWFFRLSRYEDQLRELIESGHLRIEPESRRNEVLGFIRQGLQDFSVSRSVERARGWGIPVPDDPTQVIYVWFDALINYITALDFGAPESADYRRWWVDGDEVIHVIGKGIVRFHAVYWPAMLLSAGQPVPRTIFVHDYLTVDGKKLGKSLGNAVDPVALVNTYGADALRWWLVRDVPRVGDADFTLERMISRYHEDLANGLGNLVNRTVSMIQKYRGGTVPTVDTTPDNTLTKAYANVADKVDSAMDRFDFRSATAAIWEVVNEANRYVVENAPWNLAKAEKNNEPDATTRLNEVLATLVHAGRAVADELTPFLPEAAQRVAAQLGNGSNELAKPTPLFPRIEEPHNA
jgi:methionyl-tRNA synthetase